MLQPPKYYREIAKKIKAKPYIQLLHEHIEKSAKKGYEADYVPLDEKIEKHIPTLKELGFNVFKSNIPTPKSNLGKSKSDNPNTEVWVIDFAEYCDEDKKDVPG